MWGMNDMDTALFIAWFTLVVVWGFTMAYYNEQIAYYKERWVDAEGYAATLQKIYRGELTDGTEQNGEEAEVTETES